MGLKPCVSVFLSTLLSFSLLYILYYNARFSLPRKLHPSPAVQDLHLDSSKNNPAENNVKSYQKFRVNLKKEPNEDKVFGKTKPCPGSPSREEVLSCLNQSCSVLPPPDLSKYNKRLPGAIIIGAKKAGTGALRKMLSMHSRIEMGDKDEAHFFDAEHNYAQGWKRYFNMLPEPSSPNQIIMEKTPRYFVCPAAPLRIHSMSPNISLLLIIRDPVIRLVSDFTHGIAMGKFKKPPSFDKTFISANGQINHNHMVEIGLYFKHLEHWMKYFPQHQIHVVDGDQLIKAPWIELEMVQRFLHLQVEITKENFEYNEKKGFYCMKETETECMSRGKGQTHVYVSNTTISKLRGFYKPYNRKFYEMMNNNYGWPEE